MKTKDNIQPPSKKNIGDIQGRPPLFSYYDQFLKKASYEFSIDRAQLSDAFKGDENKLIHTFNNYSLAKEAAKSLFYGPVLIATGLFYNYIAAAEGDMNVLATIIAAGGGLLTIIAPFAYLDKRKASKAINEKVVNYNKRLTEGARPAQP